MSRFQIPPIDVLKLHGIDGMGPPARAQGVVVQFNAKPINRAQRRLLARLKRRQQKKSCARSAE